MSNSNPVVTPTNPQFKLSMTQSLSIKFERTYMNDTPYVSMVGFLMYDMSCTRPDITYKVIFLSEYMVNSRKARWKALKSIVKYTKGSLRRVLVYRGGKNDGKVEVKRFVDTEYAGCMDTIKSFSGYVFTMFDTTISWKVMLHKVVALSITKAEYISLTEVVKEAL